MKNGHNKLYKTYVEKMQKIADIGNAMGVLNWDQETYMPKGGAKQRAQQLATLAGIRHELATTEALGNLLQELNANNGLDDWERRNVTESLKGYEKGKKFPTEFIIRSSKAVSAAFQAWTKAKEASDFSLFQNELATLVDIKLEACEIVGYEDHPYDALLDSYEPGEKTANITTLFNNVRNQLVDFVKEIQNRPQVEDKWMYQKFDKDKQWNFGIDILKQMGYDFNIGRQDISTHPFTTDFGSQDVRVTTRIAEDNFYEMLWSCIHEGGHALYEQGLQEKYYGLPTGSAISLGIHESQSRLWENNVGRSLPYWKANFPTAKKLFPENFAGVSVVDFYKSTNIVKPSLIRTNADELTYHFHVMIRFEIEKALIEKQISVKDIPAIWNQKYKDYLGIDVPSDAKGCLQDIHWSHGSFGYFPTYSLGSFYAAQFYAQAKKDLPDLEQQIEQGNMLGLLDWLRTNVHQYGQKYTATELCTKITGEALNFNHFMEYAKEKYSFIYGLK